jgi:hypothetical protein
MALLPENRTEANSVQEHSDLESHLATKYGITLP